VFTLQSYVLRLETITQLRATLGRVCDNSWLYWHRNFVPMYLRELYASPVEAHRLPYLFMSLRDCTQPLLTVKHEKSAKVAVDAFQKEVCGYVNHTTHRLSTVCPTTSLHHVSDHVS
jgi:hypothetical protein